MISTQVNADVKGGLKVRVLSDAGAVCPHVRSVVQCGVHARPCVEIKFRTPHAIDATCFRSCVCAMAWRFHAIDATLSS